MSVCAERLEDAYRTLSARPLLKADDFEPYYCAGLNVLRGIDLMAKLALRLERSFAGLPFKALLMGHSGVGKSTELTRLTRDPRVVGKFRVIRFMLLSFSGLERAFAVQASREPRVGARPDPTADGTSYRLARKIEDELLYPDQIGIALIRKTCCVEFAE